MSQDPSNEDFDEEEPSRIPMQSAVINHLAGSDAAVRRYTAQMASAAERRAAADAGEREKGTNEAEAYRRGLSKVLLSKVPYWLDKKTKDVYERKENEKVGRYVGLFSKDEKGKPIIQREPSASSE